MSETSSESKVYINVGDIINIQAPDDTSLHDKQFLVDYIDDTQLTLVSEDEPIILYIDGNGDFSNESIESIVILNRSESPSYAIQNGFITDTWVDIYFDTDVPMTITGQITNLEEDQIEVKSVDGDIFYIDFAYRGIPLDIPIKTITKRNAPTSDIPRDTEVDKISLERKEDEGVEETKGVDAEDSITEDSIKEDDQEGTEETKGQQGEEEVMPTTEENNTEEVFKKKITKLIMTADELKFGEDLDEISELVDLPESQQRYGIEKQTTDMLDDLLASIPNAKRTPDVMNAIHMMIQRFLQLRDEFSQFDDYNNAVTFKKFGADHKPLIDVLEDFKKKLYWIIPVVKNSKKIYNDANSNDVYNEFSDLIYLSNNDIYKEKSDIYNKYIESSHSQSDNKYIQLQRDLHPYYTPYSNPRNTNNILATVRINAPITSIVNNLDNYKSSVFKKQIISTKQFNTQEHILGQSILLEHKTRVSSELRRTPIIPNDELHLTSLMTLQEPIVRFSRINLPSTDIVTKTSLNKTFLAYWKLLDRKTYVNSEIINSATEITHDESYLTDNKEYIPEEGTMSYREYLEKIIPRTRLLFNLVKPHINENLSIYEILKYMEPFMVYQKDLTFMQYKEITLFIKEKINETKRKFDTNNRSLSALKVKSLPYKSKIFDLLMRHNDTIFKEVTEAYGLSSEQQSDAEIYNIIENYDGGELYNTAISFNGTSLIGTEGLTDLEKIKTMVTPVEEPSTECNKYVLAKKYIAVDELEEDNNKNDVYYDKKYDPTYYELIKEYQAELNNFTETDIKGKIEYIAERLEQTNGLSKEKAQIEARAIYYKKREVQEGDYAVLDDLNGSGMRYYRRTGTIWELDDTIDESAMTDDTKMFCNLDEKCIAIDDKCKDMENGKDSIDKVNMKDILNEFENTLQKNRDEIVETIKNHYIKSLENMKKIRKINETKRMKNNDKQVELGVLLEENVREKSPYELLRDTILGITDLSEKQLYISRFVNKYTRPANDGEDKWWLYCIATDTKLLPTFLRKLSFAYLNSVDEYVSVLDEIATEQGEKSDDEAFVVDKYSGYNIRPISFDTQEGYTETGFKIKSRDVLEADFNYSSQAQAANMTFDSKEAEKIYNVANGMSKHLGIDIAPYLDYILRNGVITLGAIVPPREIYEERQKNKKKQTSYDDALNSQIVIVTLSYLLISIQTSIPSVKTRKRFPGCKKSFTGFPMGGEGDLEALTYIACIARKIKSDQEPWSSLKKTKVESLVEKIKYMITKYILPNAECKDMIKKKLDYVKLNPEEEIPYSISIQKWTTFLPPLETVKTPSLQQTSTAFNEELSKNLKNGNKAQHDQLNLLRGKIIYSALKIQEHIQKAVYKKTAILTNSLSEPFLENACCDSDTNITIDYFINLAPEIAQLNDFVIDVQDTIDDMNTLKKPNTLLFPIDTKLKYPEIPNEYSVQTIYKAFIYYCKFGIKMPIKEDLRAICGEKPENFDNTKDISEIIDNLKAQGINYSSNNLNQLINVINKDNMVNLQVSRPSYGNIDTMRAILESANERNDIIIPPQFIIKFLEMTENYEPGVLMEDTPEMESMKNYLASVNIRIEEKIINFINTNSKSNNKILECIKTINEFKVDSTMDDYDNTVYKMMNYMKITIKSICKLFPNMIRQKVSAANILPPKHWGLSEVHKKDFTNIINKYYKDIDSFYNDESIVIILNKVYNSLDDVYNLSQNTLYSGVVESQNNKFYSVFDSDMTMKLLKFYFYIVLEYHIDMLESTELQNELAEVENKKTGLPQMDIIEDQEQDLEIEVEIISGITETINTKLAELFNVYANIICTHKNEIDYTYEMVNDRVNRSREKEKDSITSYLRGLTDETREIENHFKNHKLEKWSKGVQKGVRIYQKDTYDQERADMEKQMLLDMKLGKNDVVNDMNRNIFEFEMEVEQQVNEDIETEEYDLNGLPEDDDYGDMDGDM